MATCTFVVRCQSSAVAGTKHSLCAFQQAGQAAKQERLTVLSLLGGQYTFCSKARRFSVFAGQQKSGCCQPAIAGWQN